MNMRSFALFFAFSLVGLSPACTWAADNADVVRYQTHSAFGLVAATPGTKALIGALPVSLAAADFDSDGTPDLAVGYVGDGHAWIGVHRGNVHAVYPNWNRGLAPAPTAAVPAFIPFMSMVATAIEADRIVAGDFDADGAFDIVAVDDARAELVFLAGDGHGGFASEQRLQLPGVVTAMTSAEFGRRDGIADLALAVDTGEAARLLVFQSAGGAFAKPPAELPLAYTATAITIGAFGNPGQAAIAVAAGREVWVVQAQASPASATRTPGFDVDKIALPSAVIALSSRPYASATAADGIAVVTADGALRVLDRAATTATSANGTGWALSEPLAFTKSGRNESASARTALQSINLSSHWPPDLAVIDQGALRLVASAYASALPPQQALAAAPNLLVDERFVDENSDAAHPMPAKRRGGVAGSSRAPQTSVHSIATAQVRAMLPMRLGPDALTDFVLLVEGSVAPVLIVTAPTATATVNATTDVQDGNVTSIAALIATPGADGVISLREAIVAANSSAGADLIAFAIPAATDPGCNTTTLVCTIRPTGDGLPVVTEALTLDATTQPGVATTATPRIEIDGSAAGVALPGPTGIAISGGNSVVRGLVFNRFALNSAVVCFGGMGGNIIEGNYMGLNAAGTASLVGSVTAVHLAGVSGNLVGGTAAAARNVMSGGDNPAIASEGLANSMATNNVIQGNFIGFERTGTTAFGHVGNDILVRDSPDNTIGGTAPGARNVVGGITDELTPSVALQTTGTTPGATTGTLVQGNLIGTDASGMLDRGGAGIGVLVFQAATNTIGGTSTAARNVVSGMGGSSAVRLLGGTGNLVRGNLIGSAIDGVTPLPNDRRGVLVSNGATGNMIGGRTPGAANLIAFNGSNGVEIRVDPTGNAIIANSIHSNGQLGIDLCTSFDAATGICNEPSPVLLNDVGDGDSGANGLQNYPLLTGVTSTATTITFTGSLDSTANTLFNIDFYANITCDSSGNGEGATYLGTANVTTNVNGIAGIAAMLPANAAGGGFYTATATDPAGNTSEFSMCRSGPALLLFANSFE